MKTQLHFVFILLMAFSLAFGQAGLKGGSDGLSQYNAYTLGKWGIRVGGSGFGTFDSYAYSGDRHYAIRDNANAGVTEGDFKVGAFAPSLDLVPYLAIGLSKYLDIGAYMPIHGDLAASVGELFGKPNGAGEAELWASGLGDLSLWTKIRTELIPEDALFSAAFYLEVEIPTGEKKYGMRVRHPWYYNPDGYTDPFSAGEVVTLPMLIGTLDFDKKGYGPFRWNNYIGMAFASGYGANTWVWGSGLNYLPKTLIIGDLFSQKYFFEVRGESRVQKTRIPRMTYDLDPLATIFGLTLSHKNILDVTGGFELSFKTYGYLLGLSERNTSHGYRVYRESAYYGEDVTSSYPISTTPFYGAHINLSIHLDPVKDPEPQGECCDCPEDHDYDGVPDKDDSCPNGPIGVEVDSIGCPFDSDGDKVYDFKDKCPNSPQGVTVDMFGCPLDFDKDGVFDVNDQCPNTPEGIQVDSVGCPPDADLDNVPDYRDQCPNTPKGVVVDSVGCPPDTDKDGVQDYKDWCPNTPSGTPVDTIGCPLDSDKDGVADLADHCPDTPLGDKVDKMGCSIRVTKKLNVLKKGILFKTGSVNLARSSFSVLDSLAILLQEESSMNLEIQGHTDSVGRDESNQKLSENRANSAVNYLIKKNVPAERLRAAGYGESKPIADNGTEEGRQLNRRVELVPFAVKAPSDTSSTDAPADSSAASTEIQFAAPPEADEQ